VPRFLRHLRIAFSLASLPVAASSQADVTISYSGVPTPGLPGYATFTITATSTHSYLPISGFDFATQPSFGFFGPMNQVNPAGQPTIFNDLLCFECDLTQDSHFLFQRNQLTIPSGFASESNTTLRAVFATYPPFGFRVPFVQLVIPPFATVQAVGYGTPGQFPHGETYIAFSITNPFPEPSTVSLLVVAAFTGVGFVRRRRVSAADRNYSPRRSLPWCWV
jgi:hypothetical protein